MHNSTPQERATLYFFVGTAITVVGLYKIWRGWATGSWKPTQGEITEVFVSEEEKESDRGEIRTYFRCRILYTYTAYTREYEGKVIRRGTLASTIRYFAEQQLDEYHRGQKVTVYFSPRDPSQAVLKRGIAPSALVAFTVGVVMMFFCYWWL